MSREKKFVLVIYVTYIKSIGQVLTTVNHAIVDVDQFDSKFTWQEGLKTHIKRKHEGDKYACDQCDSQFTKKSVLKKHIISKHKV